MNPAKSWFEPYHAETLAILLERLHNVIGHRFVRKASEMNSSALGKKLENIKIPNPVPFVRGIRHPVDEI